MPNRIINLMINPFFFFFTALPFKSRGLKRTSIYLFIYLSIYLSVYLSSLSVSVFISFLNGLQRWILYPPSIIFAERCNLKKQPTPSTRHSDTHTLPRSECVCVFTCTHRTIIEVKQKGNVTLAA